MPTARAFDGSIHNFPEGIDPSIMDKAMADYTHQAHVEAWEKSGPPGAAYPGDNAMADFNTQRNAPDTWPSNFAQGVASSPMDAVQSAAMIGGRATDLAGATTGAVDRLRAMSDEANQKLGAGKSGFEAGRIVGDIALPAPGIQQLKVLKGVGRLPSLVNNFARGVGLSVPMVSQSKMQPESTLAMGGAMGIGAPVVARFAPLLGAAYGGYTGYQKGGGIPGSVEGAGIGALAGSAPKIAGMATEQVINRFFPRGGADANQMAAARYVAGTMPSNMTLDDLEASQAQTAAQAMGEAGGRAPTALGTLARREGATAENVVNNIGPYNAQEAKNARVLNSVARNVGVDPAAAKADMDTVVANGRRVAHPIYEVANAGGSLAPLQTQYANAFNAAITAEKEAAKQVADAERQILLLKAEQSQGQPVGNGIYNAQAEAMAAQKKLEAAQADKQLVLDHLRGAQADEANGVKGGIWSPWLDRFLKDPIAKQGLKEGLEVQRLEALKENRPFNPTEYAVTGTDELGDPIVSRVPNMRLLDATKRGLDHIINQAKDPITKQIKWDQRLTAIDGVRRRLVAELRGANPDYAKALDVSGDYLSAQEAFDKGQKTILNPNLTLAQFNQVYSKLSPAEKQAFRGGIANLFFNNGEKLTLKEGPVLTPLARKKFASALGEDRANAFIKDIEREVANQKFSRYVMPQNGSGTMGFSQEAGAQDLFEDAPMSDRFLHRLSGTRAMGVGQAARRTFGEELGRYSDFAHTAGLTKAGRDEAGNIFMMSPAKAAALLRRLQMNPPSQAIPFGWGGNIGVPAGNVITRRPGDAQ